MALAPGYAPLGIALFAVAALLFGSVLCVSLLCSYLVFYELGKYGGDVEVASAGIGLSLMVVTGFAFHGMLLAIALLHRVETAALASLARRCRRASARLIVWMFVRWT